MTHDSRRPVRAGCWPWRKFRVLRLSAPADLIDDTTIWRPYWMEFSWPIISPSIATVHICPVITLRHRHSAPQITMHWQTVQYAEMYHQPALLVRCATNQITTVFSERNSRPLGHRELRCQTNKFSALAFQNGDAATGCLKQPEIAAPGSPARGIIAEHAVVLALLCLDHGKVRPSANSIRQVRKSFMRGTNASGTIQCRARPGGAGQGSLPNLRY